MALIEFEASFPGILREPTCRVDGIEALRALRWGEDVRAVLVRGGIAPDRVREVAAVAPVPVLAEARGAAREEVLRLVRAGVAWVVDRASETAVDAALDELARAPLGTGERERLALTGTLAVGVAHEVNNPTAHAMATVQEMRLVLEEGGGAAELAPLLDEVGDALGRIRDIVRHLRTFAAADAAVPSVVELRQLLEELLALAAPELRAHARLRTELGDAPPVVVPRGLVGQALASLLLYVLHAPCSRAPADRVVIVACGGDGGRAWVHLGDEGAEAFAGTERPLPRAHRHAVALASARDVLRRAGAVLGTGADDEGGVAFRVELPADVPEADPLARVRVLVVTGDAARRRALARAMQPAQAIFAAGPEQAAHYLAGGMRPHAVVASESMAGCPVEVLSDTLSDEELRERLRRLAGR